MGHVHLDLPTSTQFVTFPTEQNQPVLIAWSEGRMPQTATYYVTKCYWGNFSPIPRQDARVSRHPRPVVVTNLSRKLDVIGETRMYIASELIEPHYAGGVLAGYHIRDLATSQEGHVSSWITMRLNACFHYGQNETSGGKLKRWIVYHPPIVPGMVPPNMFQHRFTSLPNLDFAKLGLGALAEQAPEAYASTVQGMTSFGSIGLEVVKSLAGDPLHRFLDPWGVEAAQLLQAKVENGRVFHDNDEQSEDRRITALQVIEAYGAEADNAAEDKLKEARVKDAAKFLQETESHRQSKVSWWQKMISTFKSNKQEEIAMPSVFSSLDHEATKEHLKADNIASKEAVNYIIQVTHKKGAVQQEAAQEINDLSNDYVKVSLYGLPPPPRGYSGTNVAFDRSTANQPKLSDRLSYNMSKSPMGSSNLDRQYGAPG